MSGIDELLNEDSIKASIDELCEDIRSFKDVDFVHLLWAKQDGEIKGRYYGNLDTLLANLEKAKFLLLSTESEGEGRIV